MILPYLISLRKFWSTPTIFTSITLLKTGDLKIDGQNQYVKQELPITLEETIGNGDRLLPFMSFTFFQTFPVDILVKSLRWSKTLWLEKEYLKVMLKKWHHKFCLSGLMQRQFKSQFPLRKESKALDTIFSAHLFHYQWGAKLVAEMIN